MQVPFSNSEVPVKCPEYPVLRGFYGREEVPSRLNPAEPVDNWRVMSLTTYQAAPLREHSRCRARAQIAAIFQLCREFRSKRRLRLWPPNFSSENFDGFRRAVQDFWRDCIAIPTKAPMKIAGKSWPTEDSAIVSERAEGLIGLMSLPRVVSVAKL